MKIIGSCAGCTLDIKECHRSVETPVGLCHLCCYDFTALVAEVLTMSCDPEMRIFLMGMRLYRTLLDFVEVRLDLYGVVAHE